MDTVVPCSWKLQRALVCLMAQRVYTAKSNSGLVPRKKDALAFEKPNQSNATAFWLGLNGNVPVQKDKGRTRDC